MPQPALREIVWMLVGFRQPDGLAPTPGRLVEAQEAMIAEMTSAQALDPFVAPVEIVWDQTILTFRQQPGFGDETERALSRIYHGHAMVWVYLAHLSDATVDATTGELSWVELSATAERALTGAAIIATTAVLERALDLAERVARLYLGEQQTVRSRPVLPASRSREPLARLAGGAPIVAPHSPPDDQAVRSGARLLADDQLPLTSKVYGSSQFDEAQMSAWRDGWAHGRDPDPYDFTRAIVPPLLSLMHQFLIGLHWLLAGTGGHGAWSDAVDRWAAAD